MEHDPKVKRDEQYPLLKVDESDGGGDSKPRFQPPPTVVTTGWTVHRPQKQPWLDRWPEFMSACWMTLILLAISFLVFYALGMSAYRRQSVVVFRCNNSKPASDVYFHQIVPKGYYIPFALYSQYLSMMATQYPSLRFNVYFLVDDTTSLINTKRPRLFKRLVPAIPGTLNVIVEQSNKREVRDFQRRYQNMNITIMPLSKYMAKTPLRYKWKNIPLMYLPFYARIFSVWQTGGIGMDLTTFNNLFNTRQITNHKITAILKQHNDGIETEKYVDILNSMEHEADNEIFSLFFNVINHILNQTSSFFTSEINPELKFKGNTPLVRTHRSKRDVLEQLAIKNTSSFNVSSDDNNSSMPLVLSTTTQEILNTSNKQVNNTNQIIEITHKDILSNDIANNSETPNDLPQVMIFYDILISDDVGPSYQIPFVPLKTKQVENPMKITEFKKLAKHGKQMSNHLSVSSDGAFVAVPMCYHPFLTQLLSTGCKRENPSIAIKDTLMSQCANFLRDDVYCDNIHIINSIF